MLRFAAVILTVVVVAPLASAPQSPLPAFDAASVKPQAGDPVYAPSSPDRFANPDATLKSLIAYAFDVRDFQIQGGPAWADDRRFDVNARAATAVPQATMRLMLQRLLAERFGLRTHTESRTMDTYVLVKARTDGRLGDGLRAAAVDCAAILAERSGASPPAAADGSTPACAWRVGMTATVARMFVDGAPMREFAGLLERLVRRRVVDRTGLTGTWDIRLEFSADLLPLAPPPAAEPAPPARDGLSLFTALEEQLGLKLQSERGPVPVIVIDQATLPGPD